MLFPWVLSTLLVVLGATSVQAQTSLRSWTLIYPTAESIQTAHDFPQLVANDMVRPYTITSVSCAIIGGKATVLPTLTGFGARSVLQNPLTCTPDARKAGKLNGQPLLRSFDMDGVTCPAAPCTLDIDLVSVEGTPSYLLVKVVACIVNRRGLCS